MVDMKGQIQSAEYQLPYHHFVDVDPFSLGFKSYKSVSFALSYALGNLLVFREIKKLGPTSWCDVGCGDGAFICNFGRFLLDCKCVGFDYDPRAIRLANHVEPAGDFRSVDIVRDQIDQKFDVVTLVEVFEHIHPDNSEVFLQAAGRLVNPGGHLIITVPHVNQKMAEKHYRHFSIAELADICGQVLADFHVQAAFGFGRKSLLERVNKGLLQTKHLFLEMPWLNRVRLRRQLSAIPVDDRQAQQIFLHLKRSQ